VNAILAIAAASIAAMLVVSHQPAPVTVQWSDGTTVTVDSADGWIRARYSDGTECMWRADDQASGRCIDKNGKPIKLEAMR
jgi:hypothetical protein